MLASIGGYHLPTITTTTQQRLTSNTQGYNLPKVEQQQEGTATQREASSWGDAIRGGVRTLPAKK